MFHESIGNVIWSLSGDGKREWYVLAAAEQLKEAGKVEDADEKKQTKHQSQGCKDCSCTMRIWPSS
jgi:hypothetical protein